MSISISFWQISQLNFDINYFFSFSPLSLLGQKSINKREIISKIEPDKIQLKYLSKKNFFGSASWTLTQSNREVEGGGS